MLKYEHIQLRARIRAYAFKPTSESPDRFIEGIVVRHGTVPGAPEVKSLVVLCKVDTVFTTKARINEEVHVPMEVDSAAEFPNRVIEVV